jgi:hypothetical protein
MRAILCWWRKGIFQWSICGVHNFTGSYYLFHCGVSSMYVDAIHPDMLKAQSQTVVNLSLLGIPLFAGQV